MKGRRARSPRAAKRARAAATALGRDVRARRIAAGWTLEQASERMGLDLRHLQKIESGNSNPTLATLVRVADGLAVAPATLWESVAQAGVDDAASPAGAASRTPIANPPRGVGDARPGYTSPAAETPARVVPPEAIATVISQRLAALRAGQRLTQNELAARSGIAPQYLQRVEAGRQSPTARVLARIAAALEVPIAELVTPASR